MARVAYHFNYDYWENDLKWIRNDDGELSSESKIIHACLPTTFGTVGTFQLNDWDQDGDLDAWCYGVDDVIDSAVSTHENSGDGKFGNFRSTHFDYSVMERGGKNITDAGDLNGDGVADFVSSNLVDRVPLWVDGLTADIYETPAPALFSNDAITYATETPQQDIVLLAQREKNEWHAVTVSSNALQIHQIDGANALTMSTLQTFDVDSAQSVTSADIDADGDADLLVATHGANRVFLNSGNGSFVDSQQKLGDSKSNDTEVGDFDDDGDLDHVVANEGKNNIWLNDGSGVFTFSRGFGVADTRSVQVLDQDSDGDLDFFAANWIHQSLNPEQHSKVWLNDGTGFFSERERSYFPQSYPADAAVADLNGDQKTDIVIADEATPVQPDQVLLTSGDYFRQRKIGHEPSSATVIGDLNSDGKYDIVMANLADSANTVFLNDGEGNLQETQDRLGTNTTHGVDLADLDDDGDLDVVFADDDGISIFENPLNPDERRDDLIPARPEPRIDDHGNSKEDATSLQRIGVGESFSFSGKINFANDVDFFSLPATRGQHFLIDVISGDVEFEVRSPRGFLARAERLFHAEEWGGLVIEVSADTTTDYEIRIEQYAEDHGPDRSSATWIDVPSRTAGEIVDPEDEDYFRFEATEGETYYITIYHDTLAASQFRIYESVGSSIASSRRNENDNHFEFTYEPRINVNRYLFIAVETSSCHFNCGDQTGTYTLEITTEKPDDLPPGGIPGDANGDGIFNSADFVQVFQAGEYEDDIVGNSTYETGDWNGDKEFNSADLVVAFVGGHYTQAAKRLDIASAIDLVFDDRQLFKPDELFKPHEDVDDEFELLPSRFPNANR